VGLSRIVTAIGAIDGVNTVFYAGEPYTPGFTRYIYNGRFHDNITDSDFQFTESNPDTGEVTVSEPPLVDDTVQLFIVDRRPTPCSPIQELQAVLRPPNRVQGILRPDTPLRLSGVISTDTARGELDPEEPTRLVGVISTPRLVGVLRKDCD
jgi:hypothetical protein